MLAVILSHTRAVLLGFIAAAVLAFILVGVARNKTLAKKLLWVILAGAVMLGACLVFVPSLRSRITGGLELQSRSVLARFHYWRCSLELIREKPVAGWGMGSFPVVYPKAQIKVRTLGLDSGKYRSPEIVTHPHNEFLLLLVEGGAVQLAIALSFCGWVLYSGIRKWFQLPDSAHRLRIFGCIAGLIILLVDAFFSFPLHIAPSALAATALSTILIARPRHQRPASTRS